MFPVGLWNTLRTEQLQELANFVCLHDCISTTCFKKINQILLLLVVTREEIQNYWYYFNKE